MAFTGAATTVVAQTFILQDPNGIIVANFASGGGFGGGTAPALNFLHHDVLTSDSQLWWSQVTGAGGGSPGVENLVISGPRVKAVSGFDEFLWFGVDTAAVERKFVGVGDANQIFLEATNNADVSRTALEMYGNGELFDVFGRTTQITCDTFPLRDFGTQTSRGLVYGESRHEASLSGANVPSTVAAGILLTIVLPNCPVASAWADISFTAAWLCQVAPANSLNLQIRVNGVLVTPLAYTQNNANTVAGTATLRKTFAMPVGINTIDLVEYGGAATYAILGSDQTSLTVILHR